MQRTGLPSIEGKNRSSPYVSLPDFVTVVSSPASNITSSLGKSRIEKALDCSVASSFASPAADAQHRYATCH